MPESNSMYPLASNAGVKTQAIKPVTPPPLSTQRGGCFRWSNSLVRTTEAFVAVKGTRGQWGLDRGIGSPRPSCAPDREGLERYTSESTGQTFSRAFAWFPLNGCSAGQELGDEGPSRTSNSGARRLGCWSWRVFAGCLCRGG
jgi:hypothetical protein